MLGPASRITQDAGPMPLGEIALGFTVASLSNSMAIVKTRPLTQATNGGAYHCLSSIARPSGSFISARFELPRVTGPMEISTP